jgi:hypothetical protein
MIIPIASLRVTLLHNAINLASVNSLSSMFILAMKRFSSLIIGGEACSFDYINAYDTLTNNHQILQHLVVFSWYDLVILPDG